METAHVNGRTNKDMFAGAVRRMMRRGLATVVGIVALLLLAGCTDGGPRGPKVGGMGPAGPEPSASSERGDVASGEPPAPRSPPGSGPTRREPLTFAIEGVLEGRVDAAGDGVGTCAGVYYAINNWTECWFLYVVDLVAPPATANVSMEWTPASPENDRLELRFGAAERDELALENLGQPVWHFARGSAEVIGSSTLAGNWTALGGDSTWFGVYVNFPPASAAGSILHPRQTFAVVVEWVPA